MRSAIRWFKCKLKPPKKGIISLLEQPLKDQLYLDNWRPLSLLNCDGKIYAKILANRMAKVMKKITSKDQFGFIKDKYIGENLLDLLAVIEYCNDKKIPVVVVSLDMAKAFDKVEWSALQKILKFFNFGDNFCHMVQMLFKGITSCTINNGYTSEYFKLSRSLRQGCPFSPPAFLLIGEILGQKIKQNEKIEGITLLGSDREIKKTAQYTDDLWASIKGNKENLTEFFKEVGEFTANTGLDVNYNKTQIMHIGSLRGSKAMFYSEKQLHWSDHIRVLGMDIYSDMEKLTENYQKVINKITRVINTWYTRAMSPIGKIMIINTLAASQLIYQMSTLQSPTQEILESLKKLFCKFIWQDGKPLIAYNVLIKSVQDGRLQLVHLGARDLALKVTWIKRSISGVFNSWKKIFSSFVSMDLIDLWECNIHHKDVKRLCDKSIILCSIWEAWAKLNYYVPTHPHEILNQNIWYNSHILIKWCSDNKLRPGIIPKFYSARILSIKSIYDTQVKKLKTFREIKEEFNLDDGDHLNYQRLITAIPAEWRKKLKNCTGNHMEVIEREVQKSPLLHQILHKDKIAKYVYPRALEKVSKSPKDTSFQIWNVNVNAGFTADEWCKIREKSFKISLSVKLRYFQYRLLSNKITTNAMRAKWDKSVPSVCSNCNQNATETILHILYYCNVEIKFWNVICKWFKYVTNLTIEITERIIIANNFKGENALLVNTIILVSKQYLFAARCLKADPNIFVLLDKLRDLYYVEKELAIEHKRLKAHWSPKMIPFKRHFVKRSNVFHFFVTKYSSITVQ